MNKNILMLGAALALTAFDANAEATLIEGTNVSWEVVQEVDTNNNVTNTVLKITGSGNMPLEYNSDGSNLPWKAYTNSITKIEVGGTGETVSSISKYAFVNSKNLTNLSIADSVKTIGKGAFQNASSITSITVPNSVTSIGEDAFKDASSLQYLKLSDKLTTIAKHAFENAVSLKALKLPSKVTTINEGAFSRAESLKEIDFGGVKTIGNKSFAYAFGLESLVIPNSVTKIGGGSFVNNVNLKSVVIGDNVETIGDGAFSIDNGKDRYHSPQYYPYTSQLKEVTLGEKVSLSLKSTAFVGCPIETLTINPNNPNLEGIMAYFLTKEDSNGNKMFNGIKTIKCIGNISDDACEAAIKAATKDNDNIDTSKYTFVGNAQMPSAKTLSDEDLLRAAGMLPEVVSNPSSGFNRDAARASNKIYTVYEANLAAGKKNKVMIRYR